MSANSRIQFGLQIVFVCLYITPSHYHHCANFIWKHWTYKMPVRYNLSSVWVRLSIFSQLSIIQYVGLCVFSLPISFVMIERIYILCLIIIIKSEVWTITHCLGLGHETMVCALCLSIFLLVLADSGAVISTNGHRMKHVWYGTHIKYGCIMLNGIKNIVKSGLSSSVLSCHFMTNECHFQRL